MLIGKDYCDKDTCFVLRELGYNPNMFYDDGAPAIHLWYAQKFLREEKDMNVYVKAFNGEGWYYIIQNYKGARIYPPLARILVLCHSYEEALSEGLRTSIKILRDE